MTRRRAHPVANASVGSLTGITVSATFLGCATSRPRSLGAIVNEEPVAWPDEVLGMGPACVHIFVSKIHWARMLQVVGKTIPGEMVVKEVSPHFNLCNIGIKINSPSILQGNLLDLLNGCFPESVRYARALLAGLHNPEFNWEAWIFGVYHE